MSLITSPAEAELRRGICRDAGRTIRCETGDVLMESRTVRGLHIRQAGPQVLRLPPDCTILKSIH